MPSPPDIGSPSLIDRIPLTARTVLDIGCGDGARAAAYRRRNPAARYFGIEPDQALARLAMKRLDQLSCAAPGAGPFPFSDQLFDCIVYDSVLETVADPAGLIRDHLEHLAEHGTLVLAFHNVDHSSLVERILRGAWAYDDDGLMARKNLHLFSRNSMLDLLAAAGLHVADIVPVEDAAASREAFVTAMEPALHALGIDVAGYRHRAAPLRYIVRAARRPVAPLEITSTILPPVGGVSEVRVRRPMAAIASEPGVTANISDYIEVRVPEVEGKITILHRPALLGEAGLEFVRTLTSTGSIVICEFDDHPDFIPILRQAELYNFRGVHAVQTSTEALAEVLRQHNPEVAVFPNAVSDLPDIGNYTDLQRMKVMVAGINRESDWPPYIDALNAVAATAEHRLHFEIVGDRRLFDELRTPHKRFTPLCDYDTYNEILRGCEIAFMPLADSAFNRCKSDLKFIEAAAHRVVALASPVVYSESIRDGQTGIIFRDSAELYSRLLRLIANPEIARSIADEARAYVSGHRMLAYQVGERLAWYRSLLARHDALHAALLARVPRIAAPPPGADNNRV